MARARGFAAWDGKALTLSVAFRLRAGDMVMTNREVERFPHFSVPPGRRGTVVHLDVDRLVVKMDDYLGSGADEWDNCVHWDAMNYDSPSEFAVDVIRDVRPWEREGD